MASAPLRPHDTQMQVEGSPLKLKAQDARHLKLQDESLGVYSYALYGFPNLDFGRAGTWQSPCAQAASPLGTVCPRSIVLQRPCEGVLLDA